MDSVSNNITFIKHCMNYFSTLILFSRYVDCSFMFHVSWLKFIFMKPYDVPWNKVETKFDWKADCLGIYNHIWNKNNHGSFWICSFVLKTHWHHASLYTILYKICPDICKEIFWHSVWLFPVTFLHINNKLQYLLKKTTERSCNEVSAMQADFF